MLCYFLIIINDIKSLVSLLLMLIYDLTGLDVLAIAKREESKVNGGFKTPRERVASVVASLEEEENNSESVVIDETGSDISTGIRSHSKRRYREISASDTPRTGILLFMLFYQWIPSDDYSLIIIYELFYNLK